MIRPAQSAGYQPFTANDFSARFNLRGGQHDESVLRIDSLDLVDPFHMKDLHGSLSILDSNLIGRVDVLPGGYSARFSNSASGVVNISTLPATGSAELYHWRQRDQSVRQRSRFVRR